MQRRDFLKTVAFSTGVLATSNLEGFAKTLAVSRSKVRNPISKFSKPVAIAMWDFSWLLRHHSGTGEFEDWDKVLDELAERGYNAIRIDAFPHLVAANAEGKIQNEFYYPKADWKEPLWGNKFSVHTRPRQALLEFLPKCGDRGIHVGLSTWFFGEQSKRNEQIKGLGGLVRVWDETLEFLDKNGLLDNVMYVDLLNEYPLFNGFDWLKNKLKMLKTDTKVANIKNSSKEKHKAHDWVPGQSKFNEAQRDFYRKFMTDSLKQLSAKWPGLDFFTSLTRNDNVPWQDMDFSQFALLDVHLWFVLNAKFASDGDYWTIHAMKNDLGFEKAYAVLHKYWQANKEELTKWMENEICSVEKIGKQYGIPYGNTEGWGPIYWMDHPALHWEWVKQAGEIGARLGAKHGYMFNCSSNFTHPQFPGLWKDIKWHRKVTSIIRQI